MIELILFISEKNSGNFLYDVDN